MTVISLFSADERRRMARLAGLSVATGVLNSLIMSLIGMGFGRLAIGEDAGRTLVGFLVAFVGMLIILRRQRLAASELVADFLCRFRLRIADRLANLELRALEVLDRGEVMNCLAADTRIVAESVMALVAVLSMLAMIAFMLVYFVWLSPIVFWLTTGVCLIGLIGISAVLNRLQRAETTVAEQETRRFAAVGDLVDGFKELKLNTDRRTAFFAQTLVPATEAVYATRTGMGHWVAANYIAIEVLVLSLGAVVFLALPLLDDNGRHTAMQAGIVLLSLPAFYILEIPTVFRAWMALVRLQALDQDLARREGASYHHAPIILADETAAPTPEQPVPAFRYGMEFNEVYFRYVDADGRPGFAAGPLSFDIEAGAVHYVTGGNGSGKSTILKLAVGLYRPLSGQIRVDGATAGEAWRRRLSAAVFTDTHVFDRLYGYRDADPERVNALLDHYGIGHKTRYKNGRFTNLDLSTGQKKRVAMVAALLQDRPLYVFDEWAADQDPEFRERFYTEFLPELRDQGKTVVAATHDDRYFERADHLYQFDKGTLVDEWHASSGGRAA